MTFIIQLEMTKTILKGNPRVDDWHNAFVHYFPKYEINTSARVAGFLAQCATESNNFKVLQENLNYSAEGLNKTFAKYFIRAGRDANAYARQPEKIANVVYANRIGNGDIASGDGWRFRGRGPIQLTGRANYANFGKTIGKTAEEVVTYMETLEGALEGSLWFWKVNNLNSYCDSGNIIGMSRRVNGGDNGLEERVDHWNQFNRILSGNTPVLHEAATVLRLGAKGPEVEKLQRALGITVDGDFGPNTENHLKRWQSRNGLVADGIAGPFTLQKLYRQ